MPVLVPPSAVEKLANLVGVIASIPQWIGGPLGQIVGGYATELKIKRVTRFIEAVAAECNRLRTEAAEKFVTTEDFADIFEKTAQAVADERHEGKRILFANYLLNNIASPGIKYDERLKCLRLLEQIETRHIDLVRALLQSPTPAEMRMMISAPSATILRRVPHLGGDLPAIVHETNTLGLTALQGDYMNVNMTGGGAAQLAHSVTPLGHELMRMIEGTRP